MCVRCITADTNMTYNDGTEIKDQYGRTVVVKAGEAVVFKAYLISDLKTDNMYFRVTTDATEIFVDGKTRRNVKA